MSNILPIIFIRITWDKDRHFFTTKASLWFKPKEYISIVRWILYYLERALWINYYHNVRNEFNDAYNSLRSPIFINPYGTLINMKSELKEFWKDLHLKFKSNPKFLNEIEEEFINKTYEEIKSI